MYNCECKVQILSGNDLVGKIAREAEPLEDCGFEVSFLETIDMVCDICDSVLIIDADDAVNADLSAFHEIYKVVVMPKDSAEGYEELIAAADAVWTDTDCEALVKANYVHMQKEMKLRFDMRRMNTCLETAIDSIPDLVWFKDDRGRHLIVNDGFCKAVDKTKEMIYKQGHYYIWDMPEEEYQKGDYVCLESEEVVMRARQTVLFDEKVKTKMGMKMFKTYKSPLIDSDGTIFGTCGVAHDVTDLQNINIELDAVLNSIPFTVIVEDKNHEIVSVNPKFAEYFPECGDVIGRTRDYWQNCTESMKTYENGMIEIVVCTNDGRKILLMNEDVICDTFGEPIGEVFVLRDITVEHQFEELAAKHENTDLITGINNRRSLSDYLDKMKNEPQLTLTTVDIDNFKEFNERYDHDLGDRVLKRTAQKLCEIYPTDFVARVGDDRFVVVSTAVLSDDEIKETADRALNTLASAYSSKEYMKAVSVSLGIASQKTEDMGEQNIELLMHKSENALYSAKRSGKSKYCIF